MAQHDPRDLWWVPAPFDGAPLAPPIRVAVTRNRHGYPMHPGIVGLIEHAARYLSDAVVAGEPPSILEPARGWFSVLVTEMQGTLGPTVAQHGKRRHQTHLRLVLGDRQASGPRWLSRRPRRALSQIFIGGDLWYGLSR
jgi:amidase